jgi:hypothetical protein
VAQGEDEALARMALSQPAGLGEHAQRRLLRAALRRVRAKAD